MKFKIALILIFCFQSNIWPSNVNNDHNSGVTTHSSIIHSSQNTEYQEELRAFLESIGIRPFENQFDDRSEGSLFLDFFGNENQNQREDDSDLNALLKINNNENQEACCSLSDCQLI